VYVIDVNFEFVGIPPVVKFCYQFKVILCKIPPIDRRQNLKALGTPTV
jgi:hypothetical protein